MQAKYIRNLVVGVVIIPLLGFGQSFRGRVIDEQTLDHIPYVNIGVLKGERGTVSNDQGCFRLDLVDVKQAATVRFSFIGYENHEVTVAELSQACSTYCDIRLTPKVLEMQDVVVYAREYEDKLVGNPKPLQNATAGFKNDSLGYEMGIRVRIKERPTLLKEFRIHGLGTTYDTIFYRLNVYDMDGRDPDQNILKEPIYITLIKSVEGDSLGLGPNTYTFTPGGDVAIDLTRYHIIVQDDFVISLEYVRELGEGSLQIRTGFLSGKAFYRRTSQAEWHSIPLGLGMSVLVRYEK